VYLTVINSSCKAVEYDLAHYLDILSTAPNHEILTNNADSRNGSGTRIFHLAFSRNPLLIFLKSLSIPLLAYPPRRSNGKRLNLGGVLYEETVIFDTAVDTTVDTAVLLDPGATPSGQNRKRDIVFLSVAYCLSNRLYDHPCDHGTLRLDPTPPFRVHLKRRSKSHYLLLSLSSNVNSSLQRFDVSESRALANELNRSAIIKKTISCPFKKGEL
jgi:hypothetical protein